MSGRVLAVIPAAPHPQPPPDARKRPAAPVLLEPLSGSSTPEW
ncbi:hypothetical protein ACFV2N_11060 [Streptomyces sp. NPDC059680]